MKSLRRRFNKMTKKYFGYSDYLIFCETIRGQNFSEKTLRNWFGKLIDKNDYDSNVRKSLIAKLLELNKPLEKGLK